MDAGDDDDDAVEMIVCEMRRMSVVIGMTEMVRISTVLMMLDLYMWVVVMCSSDDDNGGVELVQLDPWWWQSMAVGLRSRLWWWW